MDHSDLAIIAMAAKCRESISAFRDPTTTPLQSPHLRWMCDQIEEHADDWPQTKLHRALLANRTLDLDGVHGMFDEAKVAHADLSEDLLDHLDPRNESKLDLGGAG